MEVEPSSLTGSLIGPRASEIKHYGIPGMKWGVRRTPEQLRRAARKRGDSRDWDTAHAEAKTMSDSELRSRINRMQMEKQYADLSAPKNNQKTNTGARKALTIVAKEGGKLAANIAKQELTRQVQKELRNKIG